MVKNTSANAGDAGSIPWLGRSPGGEMATHSSILAWTIPWTEEPGGLQSKRLQRVDLIERLSTHSYYVRVTGGHSSLNQSYYQRSARNSSQEGRHLVFIFNMDIFFKPLVSVPFSLIIREDVHVCLIRPQRGWFS